MMARSPVRYETKDGVGVITVDNPPLNVVSNEVRDGLMLAIRKAEADPVAKAVVLIGEGRNFAAGADIYELTHPYSGADINDIGAALEDLPKPVVAALHGTPVARGLEVALACHYRIAAKDAFLGLPEVKVGLLPGGGGTQRLPRLVGAKAALDMVISGDLVPAAKAKAIGLVDEVVDGDILTAAIAFAKSKSVLSKHPKTRELSAKIAPDRGSHLFEERRDELRRRQPFQHAQFRCVDSIESAVHLPFSQGLKRERELFNEALDDDQSKALIHAFFAEREAAKIPGFRTDVAPREIRSVAVVGSGHMGGGIAMAFANAGFPVIVLDRDQAALSRGLSVVAKNYESMVRRGRLDQPGMNKRLSAIRSTVNYKDLADVDLVVEAAFEDIGIKEQVFRDLDRACKKGAIFASNTSTLDIDEIAGFTRRPGDVIGMHFFSPANVQRLVEVVRGKQTSADVLATAMTVAKKIGKIGVAVGNCDGFAGNRMLEKYVTEAMIILEEGATPAEVDTALTRWGLAMGPFAVFDLTGIDVNWHIRQRRLKQGKPYGSALLDRFYDAGRFGQKTGKGFYRYETGSRAPLPDPEADAIIEAYRREVGPRVKSVSEQEIVKRTIYALVNEGANILDEGVVYRSGDIDTIYINGYGFPAWRGGPMKYAELRGLAEVLSDLDIFHMRFGDRWKPAPLLKSLVTARKPKWPR
ncbi:3-hydroxyacyl-CoA dehydrogenase NAD-binding domain-containing protein [Rhodomicrobium lacus]|uniref:3-hydroxyacyl-CoA dehydrogenase NAD-binding domain-containing protein n=1 Tax=Rhodomicrobium lacus TaxID=2498452 RepID=UPI0026E1E27C|nr:3-hydroxyacyl-CoA dehydrogenase NAD-binding domain-containing protein [Rhodomicrobium lacus]WKW50791.1 3-hydroxyacyl-CoA dehydrogenase NAD-binding domain-containing protein [Rhodomicrobium lacus]